MAEVSERSVLRRRLEVAHELEEDQSVAVFDDQKSELIVLNATGGAIWNRLDGRMTLEEIAKDLLSQSVHAPEYSEVLGLVLEFSRTLVERGAAEVVVE